MRASRPTAKPRSPRALVKTTLQLDARDYLTFQSLALAWRRKGHRLASASKLIREAMSEYLEARSKRK